MSSLPYGRRGWLSSASTTMHRKQLATPGRVESLGEMSRYQHHPAPFPAAEIGGKSQGCLSPRTGAISPTGAVEDLRSAVIPTSSRCSAVACGPESERQRRRCREPRQPDHGQPRRNTKRATQRPDCDGTKAGRTAADHSPEAHHSAPMGVIGRSLQQPVFPGPNGRARGDETQAAGHRVEGAGPSFS